MEQFRGGPLEDGRDSQIHSLVVYMQGDGRSSIGAYVQVYDEDVPLGVFEWHPDSLRDHGERWFPRPGWEHHDTVLPTPEEVEQHKPRRP